MKEEKDTKAAAFIDFVRTRTKADFERSLAAVSVNTIHCERLFFSMQGANEAGFTEHPQKVVKMLGIKYVFGEPNTLTDSWIFYDCSNVPEYLPKFLHT